MANRVKEASYYPAVQQFLTKRGYVCESIDHKRRRIDFICKGIGQIIIDVFGVKAAPSRYSTDVVIAAVEVKRSRRLASLRAMHQALNNCRLAHYCYLAMPHQFTGKERSAAAELGIGLLTIGNGKNVRLESESRRFQPDGALIRAFLRLRASVAQCTICGNFSSLYDIPKGQHREGGGWRKNAFAPGNDRWAYFCKQCRERFENAFTERWLRNLKKKVKRIEERQKDLAASQQKLAARIRKRRRGNSS